MNQKDYLKALEDALNGISSQDKADLMADFKEHFDIGLSEGKTEQEIIDHLGPVKDLVDSLDLKRLEQPQTVIHDHNQSIAGPIEEVIIDGLHADVTIMASDDDQVHVDYEIAKSVLGKLSTEVNSRQEGKTLYVTVSATNRLFRPSLDPVDLTIQCPKFLKHLSCKTASGDIQLDELSFEELELHSLSGDINVGEVKATSIKVTCVSGDISLSDIQGDLQLNSVSGDVDVEDHDGSALTVETVSGDIDYEGSAQAIRSNTTSGDASFKAEKIQTLSANTVSGDTELQLDIEHKGLTVSFISHSGELQIGDAEYDTPRHNQTITIGDGSVKVNLKSISGDFTIE